MERRRRARHRLQGGQDHRQQFRPVVSTGRRADRKPRRQLEQAAAQGRVEDEGWRVRGDGSRFWANVVLTALQDESGQLRRFLKITCDFTERKQAEETLRLQSVVTANMSEGICAVRKSDAAIVYANPTFEHLFGYDSDELTGKPVGIINTPGEAGGDIVRPLNAAGVWKGESLNRKKKGCSSDPGPASPRSSIRSTEPCGSLCIRTSRTGNAQQALEVSQQALRQSREELRATAARLLTVQEEERRLSRYLHDDVNQRLAMLTVEVETLESSLPSSMERIGRRLRTVQNRLAERSDDVRRLPYQSCPSILDDLDLPIALKRLSTFFHADRPHEHLRAAQRRRTVAADGVHLPLPGDRKASAIQTGTPTPSASIWNWPAEQQMALTVRDNGCGFDLKLLRRR